MMDVIFILYRPLMLANIDNYYKYLMKILMVVVVLVMCVYAWIGYI